MQGLNSRWGSSAACATACVLLLSTPAAAQESLCRPDETAVFACHLGARMVALCRPPGLEPSLTYRFGTPERVELAYPPPGARVQPVFRRSLTPLVGGGISTVTFQRGQYEYRVYSKVERGDDAARSPRFEDGVEVWRGGKRVRELVCDDGGAGFRENLDWLPEAKKRP